MPSGPRGSRKALYRLSSPLEGHEYVVVSAVDDESVAETFIFGSSATGLIYDYQELEGSSFSPISHAEALLGAGYRLE